MRPRGFTLLELVLVLAIIVIIAAIVFPIFSPARDPSYRNICPGNQKYIGLAILQYAQDNDETMPNIAEAPGSKNTWRSAIEPYIRSTQVFQCRERDGKQLAPDGFPQSYAANYSGNYNGTHFDKGHGAFAGPGSLPVSLSGFKAPAHLIAVCEVADSRAPEFNIDDAVRFGAAKHILWAGHSGGSNYLFVDGHVKHLFPTATASCPVHDAHHRLISANLWYRDRPRPLSANGIAVLKEAQKRFSPSGAKP